MTETLSAIDRRSLSLEFDREEAAERDMDRIHDLAAQMTEAQARLLAELQVERRMVKAQIELAKSALDLALIMSCEKNLRSFTESARALLEEALDVMSLTAADLNHE